MDTFQESHLKNDCHHVYQKYPQLPSQHQKTLVISKTMSRPAVQTQVVSPPETNRFRITQSYGSSYFLPRKISGKAVTFLLDTGYTTNLSRRLFATFSARERASLEPYAGAHGTLADRSCITFYDVIQLPGRIRDQVIHETFIVSQLKEDAILEMPFLEKHQRRMDFQKSAMVMAGKNRISDNKFPVLVLLRDDKMVIKGKKKITLECVFPEV